MSIYHLNYLDFDYSEDTDGIGTFDAMTSTWPEQVAAVQDEIVQVLDWAYTMFVGIRGPLGEGGDWDFDLQGQQEFTAPQHIEYDASARRFSVHIGPVGRPRHTVTLSISGTSGFCAAFRQQFGLDGQT
ncbi:MAG TPA: hypothetical protein DCP03_19690 [Polaromonas sp.]|uniref:hypothetical protein n=1 Tax=Polaromonas sp. UBA4122 TaxID=1947074 RepID=UPI000ED6C64E|nr:hypothetical protein [Polaromonas sp. UBA4122]HAL40200.1 hypothetical protein [Polaromonas sp.]